MITHRKKELIISQDDFAFDKKSSPHLPVLPMADVFNCPENREVRICFP